MDPQRPPAPTVPVFEKWRVYLFAYLVWVVLFAGVEGAGRKACNMPMEKWIQAGTTVRERTLRAWFRDRANECLDNTPWYAYSMGTLFTIGLLAPFGAVWVVRRRVIRFAMSQSVFAVKTAALLYGAVFVVSMAVTLASMEGIRWLYDWMG
jgi:hypothetical protein